MAQPSRPSTGDIDQIFTAIRIRLGALTGSRGAAGPPGPKPLIWKGTWTDDTDYELGDIVKLDTAGSSTLTYLCIDAHTSSGNPPVPGGNTQWHEISPGYLIIDGSRAMTGDLNMDSHEIDNILNAHVVGGVGDGVIDGVRVIHMAGDDDDGEARIDGLERTIFNDEPTKSVIENPSVVKFNPAVTADADTTPALGQLSYDTQERTLVTYVTADGCVSFDVSWHCVGGFPASIVVDSVTVGGGSGNYTYSWRLYAFGDEDTGTLVATSSDALPTFDISGPPVSNQLCSGWLYLDLHDADVDVDHAWSSLMDCNCV